MTDTVLIIQTIIATIAAILLLWYTIETRKARKIASENLTLAKSALDPVLEYAGGSSNANIATLKFRNKGGTISNISVIDVTEGSGEASPSSVAANEELIVQIHHMPVVGGIGGVNEEAIKFTVRYRTQLGEQKQTTFNHKGKTVTG